MRPETITAIIPTYNCARFITGAVESALRQSVRPSQIIVVDDGSTDDTQEVLHPYRDRITVIKQANSSCAGGRNGGLPFATGDYIAFLDADDVWHPRKLELQLEALRRRPDILMLGTEIFDYPGASESEVLADALVEEVPRERLLVRNYFTASSIVIRREIVQRLGEFDATLPAAEDFEYWHRIAQIGVVANLKLPLTGYRQHAGSLSRLIDKATEGLRRVFTKFDEQDAWGGRFWLRRKSISHFHYSVAYLYGADGRQGMGLWEMVQSMAWYPFPYRRCEAGVMLGRPKRAMVLLLRLLGLKRPESLSIGRPAGSESRSLVAEIV